MPDPENMHKATLREADPTRYIRFRGSDAPEHFDEEIDVLWGVLREAEDGRKVEPVTLYFDPESYGVDEVRAWLEEHDFEPLSVQPAERPTRENTHQEPLDVVSLIRQVAEGAFGRPVQVEPNEQRDGTYQVQLPSPVHGEQLEEVFGADAVIGHGHEVGSESTDVVIDGDALRSNRSAAPISVGPVEEMTTTREGRFRNLVARYVRRAKKTGRSEEIEAELERMAGAIDTDFETVRAEVAQELRLNEAGDSAEPPEQTSDEAPSPARSSELIRGLKWAAAIGTTTGVTRLLEQMLSPDRTGTPASS